MMMDVAFESSICESLSSFRFVQGIGGDAHLEVSGLIFLTRYKYLYLSDKWNEYVQHTYNMPSL